MRINPQKDNPGYQGHGRLSRFLLRIDAENAKLWTAYIVLSNGEHPRV